MAVLILHGGPYDGLMINKGSPGLDLRVSDDNPKEKMVRASVYRRKGELATGPVTTGSYTFTHNMLSADSLVDIWFTP